MKCIESLDEIKSWTRATQREGLTIGFVPTMGYLHEGHLSLVRQSLKTCDRTVVSIFVNPKQFGPNEDLDTYPVDMERDLELLRELNVDALFLPTRDAMYPEGYRTHVGVENLTEALCGESRPGFFRGVSTVVLKLFHLVQPDRAFFGEKDRQQLRVIRKMVEDLNMDIEIVGMPIVRDADGLASSSRNRYLNQSARKAGLALHQALERAQDMMEQGETCAETIRGSMRQILEQHPENRVDYISLCDPDTFEEVETLQQFTLAALAVQVGKARLIDNCMLERVPCNEIC